MFEHEEHLSRQQAAERLADVAYALTAGMTLELRATGEQRVCVPVNDEVVLRRRMTYVGDRVEVEVQLSWPTWAHGQDHPEPVMTAHLPQVEVDECPWTTTSIEGGLMADHAARPQFAGPPIPSALRETARKVTGYWWVPLVAGIAWLAVSLVILQFDDASVTTVGVLVGLMFLLAGVQNVALATLTDRLRWVWAAFAVLMLIAAVVCFVNPEETFAGLADTLGFLFLIVGVWWMIRAFLERALNPLWWLGLISGVLMTVMAFWISGQFFIERAYVLLVFAGIWALMEGVSGIVRAFAVRRLHESL